MPYNVYVLEHVEAWAAGTLVVAARDLDHVKYIIVSESYKQGHMRYVNVEHGYEWSSDLRHLLKHDKPVSHAESLDIYEKDSPEDMEATKNYLRLALVITGGSTEDGILSCTYHSG